MKPAVVIISYYNGRSSDRVLALLAQMKDIESGYPFSVIVVVNQEEKRVLELPTKYADVRVYYRENYGYNIGAWEYGWRQSPAAEYYLFLQDECVILKRGWLRSFVRAADCRRIGLIGESLIQWNSTWDQVDEMRKRMGSGNCTVFGQEVSWGEGMKLFMKRYGIPHDSFADHIQALVMFARRDILQLVSGFALGQNKDEAICSEIAISKKVQAMGLKIRQIGFLPFKYIHHPQWDDDRRNAATFLWRVRRFINMYLPRGMNQCVRRLVLSIPFLSKKLLMRSMRSDG
jgi:hypothetical protein